MEGERQGASAASMASSTSSMFSSGENWLERGRGGRGARRRDGWSPTGRWTPMRDPMSIMGDMSEGVKVGPGRRVTAGGGKMGRGRRGSGEGATAETVGVGRGGGVGTVNVTGTCPRGGDSHPASRTSGSTASRPGPAGRRGSLLTKV
jgi:hypothetical protein